MDGSSTGTEGVHGMQNSEVVGIVEIGAKVGSSKSIEEDCSLALSCSWDAGRADSLVLSCDKGV